MSNEQLRGESRSESRGERGGEPRFGRSRSLMGEEDRRPGKRGPGQRKSSPLKGARSVDFKDVQLLKSFITVRGRIIPRRVTRLSAQQRRLYFQRMAELVAPGGVLVVRDRLPECDEATLRRRLLSAVREVDFFAGSGAERFFRPRRGARLLNVRLVGDDTDDDRRLDAMIAVPGVLAVLERRRLGTESSLPRRRRAKKQKQARA